MKYIKLNPRTLELYIVNQKPKSGTYIPDRKINKIEPLTISNIVYHKVLYPSRYAEDRRRRLASKPYSSNNVEGFTVTPKGVRYKLSYPDPWLIVLAYIAWEGVIQGLTWDVVKVAFHAALNKLRIHSLAPEASLEKCKKKTHKTSSKKHKKKKVKTAIGYSYEEYSTDGRKQRSIFFGLKRYYDSLSEAERKIIK